MFLKEFQAAAENPALCLLLLELRVKTQVDKYALVIDGDGVANGNPTENVEASCKNKVRIL